MNLKKRKSELGFTLIDILVAALIMAVMSGILLANFSKTRINISESSSIVIGAIRRAETKSISSAKYSDYHPCGYGIRYADNKSIEIYVSGPVSDTCIDERFNGSSVEIIRLVDPRIEIRAIFDDIFFLPPDPKIYLNGVSNYQSSLRILLGKTGDDCNDRICQTICVYGTGRIETVPNIIYACPQ